MTYYQLRCLDCDEPLKALLGTVARELEEPDFDSPELRQSARCVECGESRESGCRECGGRRDLNSMGEQLKTFHEEHRAHRLVATKYKC